MKERRQRGFKVHIKENDSVETPIGCVFRSRVKIKKKQWTIFSQSSLSMKPPGDIEKYVSDLALAKDLIESPAIHHIIEEEGMKIREFIEKERRIMDSDIRANSKTSVVWASTLALFIEQEVLAKRYKEATNGLPNNPRPVKRQKNTK